MSADGLLQVGRIGRAYGIKGEVYVDLVTDRTERLAIGSQLSTRKSSGHRWLVVVSASAANGRWRVRFQGIDDRTAAEALAGIELFAEPIDDPDVLWVHELIGAMVVEADGTERGRCAAVLDNPAADLLELESGALVPVTFVVSNVDGVITIDAPDGLFDLDA